MGVQVDEARTNHVTGGVNDSSSLQIVGVSTKDIDRIAVDYDSGKETGAAAPVYDQTVLDQQVNHAFLLTWVGSIYQPSWAAQQHRILEHSCFCLKVIMASQTLNSWFLSSDPRCKRGLMGQLRIMS